MMMRNKRTIRIVAVVLALLIAFSVVLIAVSNPRAGAYVTQEEIDRLREEKKEYERRKQEIQSTINTIEFEKSTEVAKKSVLDNRIILTGLEIENISETIELYNTLILEKEDEVTAAILREEAQLRTYKNRVRSMEENGVITYLEIIFDSTSFSDLLGRMDFVSDLMKADERIYNNLISAREDTEAAKEDLELTKQEMEVVRLQKEEKNEELLEQVAEASALIIQIESSLETLTAFYEEEAAEVARIQNEINRKVEELKEQEARAAASRVIGTGQLLWPAPSATAITSSFGGRFHPIHGVYMQHWGSDFNAPYGSNIIAADAGTVITSEYNSSYGNYVVISHGNGMTTLYAHMSSRVVSSGTAVAKGQTIGYCGSTGISTGPHLHFEVSLNGNKVDPANYL